jgi:hypothetical protein
VMGRSTAVMDLMKLTALNLVSRSVCDLLGRSFDMLIFRAVNTETRSFPGAPSSCTGIDIPRVLNDDGMCRDQF